MCVDLCVTAAATHCNTLPHERHVPLHAHQQALHCVGVCTSATSADTNTVSDTNTMYSRCGCRSMCHGRCNTLQHTATHCNMSDMFLCTHTSKPLHCPGVYTSADVADVHTPIQLVDVCLLVCRSMCHGRCHVAPTPKAAARLNPPMHAQRLHKQDKKGFRI